MDPLPGLSDIRDRLTSYYPYVRDSKAEASSSAS
jgi:hypothetical protein